MTGCGAGTHPANGASSLQTVNGKGEAPAREGDEPSEGFCEMSLAGTG